MPTDSRIFFVFATCQRPHPFARASISFGMMRNAAETCYTSANSSYKKGAVENCNRMVRRWHPKGTDLNQLTGRQIWQLEDLINSMHRESLNGETAYAYD